MFEYKHLSRNMYETYYENINDMNTLVYDDLYYFYHGVSAPYEYGPDYVHSPKDANLHNQVFRKQQRKALVLLDLLSIRLRPYMSTNDGSEILDKIKRNLDSADDMIWLTWAAQQLHALVSLYFKKGRFIPLV